ncbi:MAG: hypothetical protein AYL33_006050 [Candidatus Bathyarchaeota archaeon B63]|nr:MAG: hypothetical protein AYL33_006050 [Candidatus Bathyarchaeota archaeon B63]
MLCGLIISGFAAVYYYNEHLRYRSLYDQAVEELRKLRTHMLVNVLIDYGNGTREWHNGTMLPIGSSLFNATDLVADIDYTAYPFGVFITAINGRGGDPGYYWLWYIWNSTGSKWEIGPVAADAFTLHHGDTVAWKYEKPSW